MYYRCTTSNIHSLSMNEFLERQSYSFSRLSESPLTSTARYRRRPCLCHIRSTCRSLDGGRQAGKEGWRVGGREQGEGGKGREG